MAGKKYLNTAVSVLSALSLAAGPAYAEEMEKPLLRLPQVHVIAEEAREYVPAPQPVTPEEIVIKQTPSVRENEQNRGVASVAYGSFETKIYDVSYLSRAENFYYSWQIKRDASQGERKNSRYTLYQTNAAFGMPLNEQDELGITLDYFNKSLGLPGRLEALTPEASRRTEYVDVCADVSLGKGEDIDWKFRPYYRTASFNDQVLSPEYTHELYGAKLNRGSDYLSADMNIYQSKLLNNYERVYFYSGVRLNNPEVLYDWRLVFGLDAFAQERFGERVSPFLEIIFEEDEDSLSKITLKREYVPIDFGQTYLRENYVAVNPAVFPAQRRSGISFDLDEYISREWRISLRAYLRQDKSLWFWDDSDGDGLYMPRNMEKADFAGIKLSTEYTWTEKFSNFFMLEVMRIESKDDRFEFLPYEPKQKISLGVNYKFTPQCKFNLVGDYFGRRFYTPDSRQSLSGYFQMNSKLTYEVKDYLTFFILVDNLLNENSEILKGYPNQSRSMLSGVKLDF